MKNLGKIIINIVGAGFALLVLGFTAFETFAFLFEVTGNALVAGLGLVLFEGGFLYWAARFKYDAEGLIQMGIALLVSVICLLGVVAAISIQLGAVNGAILGESTGAKLVTVMVVVHLIAKYAYALTHPHVIQNIYKRASEGLILGRVFQQFNSMVEEIADDLAKEMAQTWSDELKGDLSLRYRSIKHQSQPLLVLNRHDDDGELPESLIIVDTDGIDDGLYETEGEEVIHLNGDLGK